MKEHQLYSELCSKPAEGLLELKEFSELPAAAGENADGSWESEPKQ